MNITLFSLCISSHLTNSPFYAIQKMHNYKSKISILDSHFSYSFSNFVYSDMALYKMIFQKDTFSHSLKSALFLIEENATPKPTVVKDKDFKNEQIRYENVENLENLIIASCTFNKCENENGDGGGLIIQQDINVVIHGSTFIECSARNGGGAYICKNKNSYKVINDYNTEIKDDQLLKAEINYCCFDRCISRKDSINDQNNDKTRGYGSAAVVAGTEVKFYFSSLNDHHESGQESYRGRGAQFDIQSYSIFAHYLNISEGYSDLCGTIEFRYCQEGSIKFQTLDKNDCQMVQKYTNTASQLEISEAILTENTIRAYIKSNSDMVPCFIHARQSSITVSNFYLPKNYIHDNPKLAGKDKTADHFNDYTITLSNWKVWSVGENEKTGDFVNDGIQFPQNAEVITSISHLALNNCGGNVNVSQLIITPFFTNSDLFSSSQDFSRSFLFTNSDKFQKTSDFSSSREFTSTGEFSKTTFFTESGQFSMSGHFSESAQFTASEEMLFKTKSSDFSESSKFTESAKFSESTRFTKSTDFSESAKFTESVKFSESTRFTKSTDFSESAKFTESSKFTKSLTFTSSSKFSQSNRFTESSIFTQSFNFTESNIYEPLIPGDSKEGGKLKPGIIAGIAIAAAVVAALIILLAFFLIKKFKANQFNEEEIETLDEDNNVTNTNNPLYNQNASDDPFKDDFEN